MINGIILYNKDVAADKVLELNDTQLKRLIANYYQVTQLVQLGFTLDQVIDRESLLNDYYKVSQLINEGNAVNAILALSRYSAH